jgi:hypothetical protein
MGDMFSILKYPRTLFLSTDIRLLRVGMNAVVRYRIGYANFFEVSLDHPLN